MKLSPASRYTTNTRGMAEGSAHTLSCAGEDRRGHTARKKSAVSLWACVSRGGMLLRYKPMEISTHSGTYAQRSVTDGESSSERGANAHAAD